MSKAIPGHRYEHYTGYVVVVDLIAKHTEHVGHMVVYHKEGETEHMAMPKMVFEHIGGAHGYPILYGCHRFRDMTPTDLRPCFYCDSRIDIVETTFNGHPAIQCLSCVAMASYAHGDDEPVDYTQAKRVWNEQQPPWGPTLGKRETPS